MSIQSKKLTDLKKKWEDKLKKSGFIDIEQPDGNLKTWDSLNFQKNYNSITSEAKQEYYRMAGHFLYENEWDTKEERLVWSLHSQGVSIRHIVIELKKRGYRTYKRLVQDQLKELVVKMKEKYKHND